MIPRRVSKGPSSRWWILLSVQLALSSTGDTEAKASGGTGLGILATQKVESEGSQVEGLTGLQSEFMANPPNLAIWPIQNKKAGGTI